MNRLALMSVACATLLLSTLPAAHANPARKPAKATAPAKAAAPSAAPAEALSQGQLDVVDRVLTGAADCEFKQKISVEPVPAHRGHFEVRFQKARYVMTPRETATGAVRLEDTRTGMVWIQIPAKSMLMDSRRGQRVVDHCLHSEQRAALTAVKQAAESLGIEPAPAPPAPSATARNEAPAAAGGAASAPQPALTLAPAAPAAPTAPTTAAETSAPVAALPAARQP